MVQLSRRRTNHEGQEFQDPLGGLLAGVAGGGADDLLGHILGHHEQHWQDQVGRGIVPPDGRSAVLQWEQPAPASLHCHDACHSSAGNTTSAGPICTGLTSTQSRNPALPQGGSVQGWLLHQTWFRLLMASQQTRSRVFKPPGKPSLGYG